MDPLYGSSKIALVASCSGRIGRGAVLTPVCIPIALNGKT
jgi:hypothetical protein